MRVDPTYLSSVRPDGVCSSAGMHATPATGSAHASATRRQPPTPPAMKPMSARKDRRFIRGCFYDVEKSQPAMILCLYSLLYLVPVLIAPRCAKGGTARVIGRRCGPRWWWRRVGCEAESVLFLASVAHRGPSHGGRVDGGTHDPPLTLALNHPLNAVGCMDNGRPLCLNQHLQDTPGRGTGSCT